MGWIIVALLTGLIWLLLPEAKKQEISDFFTTKVQDLRTVIEDSFKVKEAGVSIPDGPYKEIDSHALNASKKVEQSISALAEYLIQPAKTDEEKTRAIFRWMTDRIAYNAEDFLAGKPVGDCSAEAVLKTRKSVCEGYANLFEQLAKAAGLEVVKISGHCKGYGYSSGEEMSTNHTWNAIKIDGQWCIVDVTWGAGYVQKEKGFIKEFKDYWFLTPPEQFIFSHFPDDPAKQFLTPPIDADTYRGWPKESQRLLMLGFQVKDIQETLNKPDFHELVEAYPVKGGSPILLIKAPLEKHLKAGTSYKFHIKAESYPGLAFINNGEWQKITPDNGAYHYTITPHAGELQVSVLLPGHGTNYLTILRYVVE